MGTRAGQARWYDEPLQRQVDRKVICTECYEDLNEVYDKKTGKYTLCHAEALYGAENHAPKPVLVVSSIECDFCIDEEATPVWQYEVRDQRLGVIKLVAKGLTTDMSGDVNKTPWLACEKCAEFIEADNPVGLALRFKRTALDIGERFDAAKIASVMHFHQEFFAAKTGQRSPAPEQRDPVGMRLPW